MQLSNSKKENNVFGCLNRIRNNNKGSILTIVVMVTVCLFLITSAVLVGVDVNTKDNSVINGSENAYLAAKSGIKLISDMGSDSSFINKVYASKGGSTIEMDFAELGKCDVKILDSTEAEVTDPISGNKTKYVIAECTGKYDDKEFVLRRKLKLNGTPTTTPPTGGAVSPIGAYMGYGNDKKILNGGMDGSINMLNHDADIEIVNANPKNPVDQLSCLGSIKFLNSDIFVNMVAAGRSFSYNSPIAIKENVYVGSNDASGSLKSNIFAYMQGHALGGSIKCEGDLILYGFDGTGKFKGITRGIGSSNYDSTAADTDGDGKPDNILKSDTFEAIRAGNGPGSKVYLGYQVDVADDNKSYSNVQAYNGGAANIYGRVVVNGDLYISGGTVIYGDIICTGTVTFEGGTYGYKIYGDIYADNIVFGRKDQSGTFPDGSTTIKIQKTYTLPTKTEDKCEPDRGYYTYEVEDTSYFTNMGVTLVQGSPVSELSQALGGAGSVAYFNNLVSANGDGERPTTVFPSSLSSLKSVKFENPACSDASIASYMEGTCSVTSGERPARLLHITDSCAIDSNIELQKTDGKIDYIYIDTAANNKNIDIYLKDNVSIHKSGGSNEYEYAGIILNDNGGNNRIRLFMGDGSSLKFEGNDSHYPGFLVVSDAYANSTSVYNTPSDPTSTDDFERLAGCTLADAIDQSKVPNFYIFAEEPDDADTNPNAVSSTTISLGQSGYIPGCVLTPYANVISDANSNCYVNNTKVGYKAPDPHPDPITAYDPEHLPTAGGPDKDCTNRPFIYGMLMCNWAKLQGGQLTSIVFNSDLLYDAATKKHYEDATSGVYYYKNSTTPGGGGSGGSGTGGGVAGFNWVIDSIT